MIAICFKLCFGLYTFKFVLSYDAPLAEKQSRIASQTRLRPFFFWVFFFEKKLNTEDLSSPSLTTWGALCGNLSPFQRVMKILKFTNILVWIVTHIFLKICIFKRILNKFTNYFNILSTVIYFAWIRPLIT